MKIVGSQCGGCGAVDSLYPVSTDSETKWKCRNCGRVHEVSENE